MKILIPVLLVLIGAAFLPAAQKNTSIKETPRVAGRPAPLKYIYLSFDDGPLNGSENIDSVVLAERLKISVFIVGEHAEQSKLLGTYFKLYEQNPFVDAYNHSYTHANDHYQAFYSNPAAVLADIEKNEQLLGLKFKIVRLPGRNMWRLGSRRKDDGVSGSAAADLLAKNNFKLFGWDLEWQHKNNGEPIQAIDAIAKEIETRLESGDLFTKDHIVLLVHDEMFQKKWEESELKQLIDKLRVHENYVFEHLRFYPGS